MTAVSKVSIDRIRELYNYDPNEGIFVRREGARPYKFKDNSPNYRMIRVDGVNVYAHRAAWAYVTGEWPKKVIDHIDGNHLNNRFCNLRDVSQSENMQNQRSKTKKNKDSGYLGVFRNRDKWVARIVVNGVRHHVGSFLTAKDASIAYLAKKRELTGLAL